MSPTTNRFLVDVRCLSIAANSLCAGGVFAFPLYAPFLSEHVKLSQPQLTSIALAGMAAQYPFSPLVGKMVDRHGPWLCSLIASCLFFTAYGGFSITVRHMLGNSTTSPPPKASVYALVALFMLAGFGTVFSYFSALFGAARLFPGYPGASSGVVNALFGLSPVLISSVASTWFTEVDGSSLDLVRFLASLAIFAGGVHLIGASNLRQIPSLSPASQSEDAEETTPLLPTDKNRASRSVSDLIKDPYFLVLFMLLFATLGPCEMIISNVGSIMLSLPSAVSESTASTQVKIIATSNTLTRLLAGPLADLLSPNKSGVESTSRKHYISRAFFLVASAVFLLFTFLWMEAGVRTQADVWVLSVGTGIAYGTIFTLLPSIISAVWGAQDAGRNLGIVVYAPFIATIVFSYLYALVAAEHTESDNVCRGTSCWRTTFWISTGAQVIAILGGIILWRGWRGLL